MGKEDLQATKSRASLHDKEILQTSEPSQISGTDHLGRKTLPNGLLCYFHLQYTGGRK